MSDQRPGGEPTEPPSEKRLRDARKRGDVAKSREIVSFCVFFGATAALAFSWPLIIAQLMSLTRSALSGSSTIPATGLLNAGISSALVAISPVLIGAVLGAVLGNYLQVRALFSVDPLKPQLKRLNPLDNVKQIFGKQALFELFKSSLKIIGFGYLAWSVLDDYAPAVIGTFGKTTEQIFAVVRQCAFSLTLRVAGLAALLAVIDLLYQRYAYRKRHRMTKEELRREHKESEGDPQHKAERQRVHREISEHQLIQSVATADCILINPTRIAVALRYDEQTMEAPQVIASGRRLIAARIRRIAQQHGVPIIRNVPLARALVDLEIDEEIPPELYETVAEVLRFVYALDNKG